MENTDQPDIRSTVKRLVVTDIVVIGAMLIVSAWGWTKIPANRLIAVHWGPSGQPDGFAGKAAGLLWMPGLAVFVSALTLAFLLIPRSGTVVRSLKAYVAVPTSAMALLLGFHVVAVMAAVGAKFNMSAVALTIVGILFVVIGNYFTKMRQNRWMGVRTPWTLASESVWDKTHRLASRLFVALGLGILVLAWSGLDPVWTGGITLTGILGVTLLLYVYSYIVWRDESSPIVRS